MFAVLYIIILIYNKFFVRIYSLQTYNKKERLSANGFLVNPTFSTIIGYRQFDKTIKNEFLCYFVTYYKCNQNFIFFLL